MSLGDFLYASGSHEYEGHLQEVPAQMDELAKIIAEKNVKNVLEVGFNAGHSADFFLKQGCDSVLSFDIGHYHYVDLGKQYLDGTYPGKHSLVLGDSVESIPAYVTDKVYDLIFIDGSSDYETIKQDLANCKRFSGLDTIVVMDDTMYSGLSYQWNQGYTRAWTEAVAAGDIIETGRFEFCEGRGMSIGVYNIMKQ